MEKPMVPLIGIGQSSDPLAAEPKMGKKQDSKNGAVDGAVETFSSPG